MLACILPSCMNIGISLFAKKKPRVGVTIHYCVSMKYELAPIIEYQRFLIT
jgi:hypothetical protein